MVPKSAKERQERKEAFKKMVISQKIQYIFEYYKLPIFTTIVAAIVLIGTVVRIQTQKEALLYIAFENVTIGDTLREEITNDYLLKTNRDVNDYELILYEDLYIALDPLPENHDFAYASKIKVLGSIGANRLDIVLMNQEAYDQMSSSGLLLDLKDIFDKDKELIKTLGSLLVENEVILEDNAVAYDLGKDESYNAKTESFQNAIEITKLPLFAKSGFDKEVYLGIIANTKRIDECINWLKYLTSMQD